jgi:hypothetical protein
VTKYSLPPTVEKGFYRSEFTEQIFSFPALLPFRNAHSEDELRAGDSEGNHVTFTANVTRNGLVLFINGVTIVQPWYLHSPIGRVHANNPAVYNKRNQNPPANVTRVDTKRTARPSFRHAGTILTAALFDVADEAVGVAVCIDGEVGVEEEVEIPVLVDMAALPPPPLDVEPDIV